MTTKVFVLYPAKVKTLGPPAAKMKLPFKVNEELEAPLAKIVPDPVAPAMVIVLSDVSLVEPFHRKVAVLLDPGLDNVMFPFVPIELFERAFPILVA